MCISKHHPATIGLVQLHVCLRARSVRSDFPRSPPTGTETTAQAPQSLARCLSYFLTFTCTESRHYKWSPVVNKSSWQLMLSSVAGMGETVSFIYNQGRSLWLNVVTARKRKSGLRHSREVTNLPVLCQVKIIRLSNSNKSLNRQRRALLNFFLISGKLN